MPEARIDEQDRRISTLDNELTKLKLKIDSSGINAKTMLDLQRSMDRLSLQMESIDYSKLEAKVSVIEADRNKGKGAIWMILLASGLILSGSVYYIKTESEGAARAIMTEQMQGGPTGRFLSALEGRVRELERNRARGE